MITAKMTDKDKANEIYLTALSLHDRYIKKLYHHRNKKVPTQLSRYIIRGNVCYAYYHYIEKQLSISFWITYRADAVFGGKVHKDHPFYCAIIFNDKHNAIMQFHMRNHVFARYRERLGLGDLTARQTMIHISDHNWGAIIPDFKEIDKNLSMINVHCAGGIYIGYTDNVSYCQLDTFIDNSMLGDSQKLSLTEKTMDNLLKDKDFHAKLSKELSDSLLNESLKLFKG